MSPTYLIARSTVSDDYSVWAVDIASDTLLTPVDPDATLSLPKGHGLTAVGNYLLEWSPLTEIPATDENPAPNKGYEFKLFEIDPTSTDPLDGELVQAGTWEQTKFTDGYEIRSCPDSEAVAPQLLGVTGYVLSFLPTKGRGTFNLWGFDAASSTPGRTFDPIEWPVVGQDGFPAINADDTLLPIENCVMDVKYGEGTWAVYSFDPQRPNPLHFRPLHTGTLPGSAEDHQLVVVGAYLLWWSTSTRAFTLYFFDPADPFGTPVQSGTLPEGFDADTTLLAYQTIERASDGDTTSPGTIPFMQQNVKRVVYYVVESRSFDSVVGWLYSDGFQDPASINWVNQGEGGGFEGADQANSNACGGKEYEQRKAREGGTGSGVTLDVPVNDPPHLTPDAILQQWSKGYADYHAGNPADMQGFVSNTGLEQVMRGYTPHQLRILNGLAAHYALSDAWYCSEAGGTTTNRATLATGSALNRTDTYEGGYSYANFSEIPRRQSLWKVLANNGITDWKIYWSVLWEGYPYTYHLWLRGMLPSVDTEEGGFVQYIDSFLEDAKRGNLPAFSFIEPVWISGPSDAPMSTSYHPQTDVLPSEKALHQIYEALRKGPDWDQTVLVVSFSKGGGLYDHQPAARMPKAWPYDSVDGYEFDVTGTRIPTLVISPLVNENTVFRAPGEQPFDHTSLAATILQWFGVPLARWGMGWRVRSAPTFAPVLQRTEARTDPFEGQIATDAMYPERDHVPTAPAVYGATWLEHPENAHWDHKANWHEAHNPVDPDDREDAVPTGVATFEDSETTEIGFIKGSSSTIQGIHFKEGAPSYTFLFTEDQPEDPTLTISGEGVNNQSGQVQTFRVQATSLETWEVQLQFENYATAGGSDVHYVAEPASAATKSGGIIAFNQRSNAGSAQFTVKTGAHQTKNSTVGAEVRFNDDSSASQATFTTWGSTGSDADTFGNVVFHNRATADRSTFYNKGGTTGDGGNSQFFDCSTAADATFHNYGATGDGANGGDTAFDGTANAGNATFTCLPASGKDANGGVVSFNNNYPSMAPGRGASAGNATFTNRGTGPGDEGKGGHVEFTGKYGAGTASHCTIDNLGSTREKGSAGYTYFAITKDAEHPFLGKAYQPDAGHATIHNRGGTVAGAYGGFTKFECWDYEPGDEMPEGPRGGYATFYNHGAEVPGAQGGSTWFKNTSVAESATLIAYAGADPSDSYGAGRISFTDTARGDTATIDLQGGVLDLTEYTGPALEVGALSVDGGWISMTVNGLRCPPIRVAGAFDGGSSQVVFVFQAGDEGVENGPLYPLLTADAIADMKPSDFYSDGVTLHPDDPEKERHYPAQFSIEGSTLYVRFIWLD